MNTCPPCNQACNQGRSCSARELPAEEQDTAPFTAEGTCNLFALVVALVGLLTIAFLGAFLIGVGYAVWPVLVSALS